MNQVITVTFDGEVLKPEIPLNLEINQKYQIQLISNPNQTQAIENKDQLDNLDQEFNWLVADLGINIPLTRQQAYES